MQTISKILKEHVRKLYESDKPTRYLSKDKVQTQESKRVSCTMCVEMFTSQQNLKEPKELDYGLNALFKCNVS